LFNNLPSGYRRLFSIVLDIAYRAYLLQLRRDKDPSVFPLRKKPEDVTGVVVIDEIDLHLHPSLQQEVIQRFKQTFPNIQLIASSHSALVMSTIKQDAGNRVYKMTKGSDIDYKILPISLYGMDVSTITELALDTIPRAKEIDERLNMLFSFIDNENYIEAKKELQKLKSEFGENLPELSKAQIMLDFFEND
jgi:AAA15 family ATPase/GTPase